MSAPAAQAATAATGSKLQQFMNHPAGPKTIFFWAPLAKWALVAAGLKDLGRPADKLSVSQNVALAATGFIWVSPVERSETPPLPLFPSPALPSSVFAHVPSYLLSLVARYFANGQVRYSFVIIPVNYSLAAVNLFVGSTGLAQLYRIYDYRQKNPEVKK